MVQQLGGFIKTIADFIKETGQELSQTKSLCTASCKKLGDDLCEFWRKAGIKIKYAKRVRALGVGLGPACGGI